MSNSRAGSRFHGSGNKRFTEWQNFDLRLVTEALAATQTFGSVSAVAAEAVVRTTLVRIRGQAFFSWLPNAADDVQIVGLGIIKVNSDAVGQSSLAVPSPTDDLDASWIWHQLMVFGPAFTATETADDLQLFARVEIDTKAQRILQLNESLVFVADAILVAGTPAVDIAATARMLLKLV